MFLPKKNGALMMSIRQEDAFTSRGLSFFSLPHSVLEENK